MAHQSVQSERYSELSPNARYYDVEFNVVRIARVGCRYFIWRRFRYGLPWHTRRHLGRVIWKRWSGYHQRNLIETAIHRFKRLGEYLHARKPAQ